ncbi:MAG: hypothetical protein EX271_10195 [Acidimicrobiales bacterium]|nr:hypothetical protein [Hyphomonadaceae bacterium]RZV40133.1 MAG: hypothetical protein EX271_10195 [Acidimicrobiales bacterium]
MNYIFKSAIASAALIGLSNLAHAGEETFTTVFLYDADAPVEETLANFEKTARKACRSQTNISAMQPSYLGQRYLAACRVELVSAAVAETQNDVLISNYQKRDKPGKRRVQFASRVKVELKRL